MEGDPVTAPRDPFPRWAVFLAAGYACLPPLLCAWIKYFPAPGSVPTGLQGADSVVFLHCMRMFATRFYSPFASCHAPHGSHFVGYYAVPFFWLYGVAGAVGRALRVDEFMALGLTNGAGVFVYLLAVMMFLHEATPRRANLTFVLFTLGGGFGGLLYMLSSVCGWTNAASFEMYFKRYTLSLTEGSFNVMAPRLYYTIPLALCVGGLAGLIRGSRTGRPRLVWWAGLLLALGTFFNLRVGPMVWTAMVLYLWFQDRRPFGQRVFGASVATLGMVVGWGVGWSMMSFSPTFARNALETVRNSLPFSGFVADTILYLLVIPIVFYPAYRSLPALGRIAVGSFTGYLAAFTLLYAAYQTYYGNWLVAREYAVTIAISDWALFGAVGGALWTAARIRRSGARTANDFSTGWVLVWFLLFFAVSISAFGHGWFMRLVPARLLAFMGLPMSMLAAEALGLLGMRRPRLARGMTVLIVTCGVTTLGVAYACFMGPLGWRPDRQAFAWNHAELMTRADAHVIARIPSGTVLTPYIPGPQFSDVISLRKNCHVILGMGTLNMSDLDPQRMEGAVDRFFRRGTTAPERRQFVTHWCVDYIFCSDTRPVDDAVAAELRATPWLRVVAEDGKAVLFKVAGT